MNEEGKGAVELLMLLALVAGLATTVSDEVRSALGSVSLTIVGDTTSAPSTGRQAAWYGDVPSLQNARSGEDQDSRSLALASSPTDIARSLIAGGGEESSDPKREKFVHMIAGWIETADQPGDGSGWVYLPREQTWARAERGPEWVNHLLDAAAGVHDDTQSTSWYASLAAAGFDAQGIVPVQAGQPTDSYVQPSARSLLSDRGWKYTGTTLRGRGKKYDFSFVDRDPNEGEQEELRREENRIAQVFADPFNSGSVLVRTVTDDNVANHYRIDLETGSRQSLLDESRPVLVTASEAALQTIEAATIGDGSSGKRFDLRPSGLVDVERIDTLSFDGGNEHVHVTVEGEDANARFRFAVSEFSAGDQENSKIEPTVQEYVYYLSTAEFLVCPHPQC